MQRRYFASIMVGVALLAGCAKHENASTIIERINDSNGKRLANLYAIHQVRHNFKGPANKAAFVRFIQQEMLPAELEGTGVDPNAIDELFVSERDKEPFFIRYGLVAPPWAASHQAVVFEEKGVRGSVAVFLTGPKVVEVRNEDVAAYRSGEKDELPEKPVATPPPEGKG